MQVPGPLKTLGSCSSYDPVIFCSLTCLTLLKIISEMTEGGSLVILTLERLTQEDWDSLGYRPYPVSKLKYNSYVLPSPRLSLGGPQGLCVTGARPPPPTPKSRPAAGEAPPSPNGKEEIGGEEN